MAQRITVFLYVCLLQVLLSTQLWDLEVVLGARMMSVLHMPHMFTTTGTDGKLYLH